ncbi:hypothetical protein PVL29_024722 [Vitis rotundifolia]|uniref:Protein kinase domain-containing protein n=1 Tax=Vitis rotundifolia TaxID=103349 RepID=A0AA38YSJ4_VITRO|nr:hypothetical protein PVL29_024722 [Vitis rotundifolia]
MVVQLTLVGLLLLASAAAATVGQAKEGCLDRCGDVSIPYPFGTNEDCYLSPYFLVTCNDSSNPPKLLLGKPSPEGNNIQVLNISVLEGELLIMNYISYQCRSIDSGEVGHLISSGSQLWSGQFNISSTRNKFTMVGCDTYAWIEGQRGEQISRTGCMSICNSLIEDQNGSCSGNGCCQTSIPDGLSAINLSMGSFYNYSNIWEFNPCGYAFVVEESHFNFSSNYLRDLKSKKKLPMTNYACKGYSTCNKRKTGRGHLATTERVTKGTHTWRLVAKASIPFYFTDINECENSILNMCENPKTCVNTQGNHSCSCPKWYHGDGRKDGDGCILNHLQVIHAAMGHGGQHLAVLGFEGRFVKLKKKYFRQNGGSELRQQLSGQGSTERIKIFTSEELEKATKNYDESNIIGRGGFGTVYKGTLTDGRIVAIKKSKMVEQSQGKDFINEMGILSQINHRHVIQLLGCCLETQVPLLVYEFINNGTLSDHIHNENKASSLITLLFTSVVSTPIIHRDVKSTNILLDDDCNAKVCDFGASRLVPLDQTQLSTAVQGTPGYLDPESMQTYRVTEKSGVYSFGVVLVELLTGKKALFFDRPQEQRILTMFFLFALKDNSLFQVLEDCIVNSGNHKQILKVAQLAKWCLSIKAEDRPTMKEVVLELEMIRMIGENAEQNPEENTYLLGESYAHYYLGGGESSIATHSTVGSFLLPVSDAR